MKRLDRRRQAVLSWFAVALLVLLQVELLPRFSVTEPAIATTADKPTLSAQYALLPLAFEPNHGQADSNVDYLVHHGQAMTAFSGTSSTTSVGDKHITMSLVGAQNSTFAGEDQLQSTTNYFIGNDHSKWQSNIPNFQKLLAKSVYPGIDLAYYGTNSTLEHDFIVSPNADYHQIAFNFTGQESITQDHDGNLVLNTGNDELHLNAPTTYQLDEHEKHTIPSKFEIDGSTVMVAVTGEYDHGKSLVIDPTLSLVYSTYLGGSGSDTGLAIAVDANSNAYIAGYTASSNFPTASSYQSSNAGSNDVFVAKINSTGTSLIYSTYLGGSGSDLGRSIAVDATYNVYLAGVTTSTNFPTVSPFQGANAGTSDAFVTKLNSSGSALTYSTYLGGSSSDSGEGLAIDAGGSANVVGYTASANFPTTAGVFQVTYGGGQDGFVTRISADGSLLSYSSFLGGSGSELNSDIALDATGNVYITGWTASSNFPTVSPYQSLYGGGAFDVYVAKVAAGGSSLSYSTYLGGSGEDAFSSIVVDSGGNAYVAGQTSSLNFPTSSPYQSTKAGGVDLFVTKLNSTGSGVVFSTYLGGSADEGGTVSGGGLFVDTSGNIFVSGSSGSTDFPVANPYQAANAGPFDAVLVKMNSSGSALLYSTYLGGSGTDLPEGIVQGINGNLYVIGFTNSSNFPTATPLQVGNAGGSFDVFLTQLTEHTVNLTAQVNPTLTFTVDSTSCALGTLSVSQTQFCTYALTAATNGTSGYAISYLPVTTLTSGVNTVTALSTLTASTLATEQFGINLRANTAAGSHTASNFGADVSGGSGTVASAYNTANSFKLVAVGDTIATVSAPSVLSTYTVSTIANIASTTEAGAYATTLTYNIVAGY